ncbi:efflux RND transporter periplasmic adaptor subunit [Hymenobacter sp. DH14]|uniref:Efflux RND transporter periplasmic adaptor subunit n=1 Tax=Hymenobacter cyanobacteriorum TaxID=2926463 RepID=A0A9X1VG98_9BACT|nr:efflux RND transporter periplasmic adaptor subunit [Hymenobacter cyanobacteriorum]MCI1188659.1 efflux RND transporter periplasmic adaptor subunit [Hymenobacter cyanobacteriorum]
MNLPNQSRRRQSALALPAVLGLLFFTACTPSDADALDEPAPQAIVIQSKAAPEAAPETLVLSGEIAADANRTARVFPRVGGQVLRVGVDLGDEVKQSQVLAVLQSREIAELQNQSTAGTAELAVARKNLAVAEELFDNGLAAGQDVFKARAELARATGTATRNHRQLDTYGMARGGQYELKAPVSGYVIEKNVAAGLRFNAADMPAAFTVANLDSVWVMANVFEADLTLVHRGQAVEITTLSYPDQPLQGRINQVFHVLDHDSKVMKVRCTLPNPGHLLKPGMHAQVRVLAASTK